MPLMVEANELKLLSWNVFQMPTPINMTMQGKRTFMQAQKIKESGADIVLLQEAWRGKFRASVRETLKKSHPYFDHMGRNRRMWKFMNSGLMVLSKHPFKVLAHHFFDWAVHADKFASKGIILIEMTLPSGEKVQVATTHLQAWDDTMAQKVRLHQFKKIKALLKKFSRPGVAQLLVGDFNVDGKAYHEFPKIVDLMKMDFLPIRGDLDYTTGFEIDCYKTPGGNPFQWLDHVWLMKNGTDAFVADNRVRFMTGKFGARECALSDHHAVEATIGF